MVSSSFAAVTARTFHPQESPVIVKQVWSNIVKISLRLDELEQFRKELKSEYEVLTWSLTEIVNAPPKNLSEEKGQHILNHQSEWEEEINAVYQEIVDLDKKISYFSDVNEDLQLSFRESTQRLLDKIEEVNHKKAHTIMEQLSIDNPDVEKAINNIFNQVDIQELYFSAADPAQSKTLTQKLKQFFKKAGKNE